MKLPHSLPQFPDAHQTTPLDLSMSPPCQSNPVVEGEGYEDVRTLLLLNTFSQGCPCRRLLWQQEVSRRHLVPASLGCRVRVGGLSLSFEQSVG